MYLHQNEPITRMVKMIKIGIVATTYCLLIIAMLNVSCIFEPAVENYVLRGHICDNTTKLGIDSVAIDIDFSNRKGFDRMYDKIRYSKNGIVKIALYSLKYRSSNDLLTVDYGFNFAKEGYESLDTTLTDQSLTLGTQGNYTDTVYFDTLYLMKVLVE
jgi:hypothetical protein